jgi:filamentous hemagglutinin family protein
MKKSMTPKQTAIATAVACVIAAGQALANGTDPTVVAGQASFSASGSSLNVTNNPGAIINWQGFSIGAGESTRFIQQSATSSVLNRVIGPDPSLILGTLTSNGRVFLINPSGILFGQGARIDVAALVASTLNLSNPDFLAGRLNFTANPLAGKVENRGSITTPSGGSVYLVGSNVSNSGIINSPQGQVILAAGQSVKIFDTSTPGVSVELTAGDNNAVNLGEILAQSGQVGIYGAVLRNTGIINADQVMRNASGKIVLQAKRDVTLEAGSRLSANGEQAGAITVQSETGTTLASGTIEAKGTGALQAGGTVQVLGDKVGLLGGHINASGDAGGGTVLIGGDYQGKNPDIQNATATYMSADSTINADAISNGNGGKVVLWSNDSTRAYGSLSARGGSQSGDGGTIETSGHALDVAGIHIDASATIGKAGNWLLDPADITITDAASDPSFSGGSPNAFTPASGANAANVSVTDIITALATTGVTVNTANTGVSGTGTGNITVATTTTPLDWTATTTLTLNAANDVSVNGAVTGTNGSFAANAIGGNVNVNAATKTTTGNLSFTARNDVTLAAATTVTTGNITAVAGHDVIVSAASTVTTGNIRAVAGHDVIVSAASTVTTGDMILRGDNDGTGPGVAAGTVSITCGSNCLTITTGNLSIRFNPASYASTGAEITAYDGNLTGAGVLDAKGWVFGKGDNKLYDSNTTATVSGLKPDIPAANPPITGVLAPVSEPLFDTKHVGTNKLITFGSTFSDSVYDLFAPFGSAPGTYTTRADILVRPLTVSAVTDSRVYDRTTGSTGIPTYTGLQTGDALNGLLTQAYADKKVLGTLGSTLVASGPYTVTDGNGGNNYTVTVNTAAGTITPLTLVGSITADNKVYDGNNTATILTRTLATPISGDTVNYVGGTALFSDKNAAPGKTVTATGLSLAGGDAGNYTVNSTATTQANITPASLGITASSTSKTYGSTMSFGGTEFSSTGLKNGETVGSVSLTSAGAVATAGVTGGPYGITPSAANGGTFTPSNYTITYVNGVLSVTPVSLVVTADAKSKVYGTTDPALTFGVAGLVNNPALGVVDTASTTLSGAIIRVPGEAMQGGPYAIIQGTLAANSNYILSNFIGNALTITPAMLDVAAHPQSKRFGTIDPALTYGVTGLVKSPVLGIADTAVSVLSGALVRVPGESTSGSPYAITRGSLAANSNYTLGFTPSNLIIIGAATEPIAGFNPSFDPRQFLYVGVTNSAYYYPSGNFWHISLNPDNADPGFDVIWGTTDLSSRVSRSMDSCESVTGGGFCGTWSFPQQLEKVDKK